MQSLGIDLASRRRNTAACVLEWRQGTALVAVVGSTHRSDGPMRSPTPSASGVSPTTGRWSGTRRAAPRRCDCARPTTGCGRRSRSNRCRSAATASGSRRGARRDERSARLGTAGSHPESAIAARRLDLDPAARLMAAPRAGVELRGRDSNPNYQSQNLACCQLHHPAMGGAQYRRIVRFRLLPIARSRATLRRVCRREAAQGTGNGRRRERINTASRG